MDLGSNRSKVSRGPWTFEKLQKDRIQAFKKYQNDVVSKKFPSKNNVIFAEKKELEKFKKLIKKL